MDRVFLPVVDPFADDVEPNAPAVQDPYADADSNRFFDQQNKPAGNNEPNPDLAAFALDDSRRASNAQMVIRD